MKHPGRKLAAVAIVLLPAALAAAGCGLGPGKDLGGATVTVTRDFGAQTVVPKTGDTVSEADTVMRVLERNADIETRYSGGFVQSIDGLEEDESGSSGPQDWFFYVNGVESTVGAAQYPLHGGESIWWDYHDWGGAIHIPAVVGAFPKPLAGGYEGEARPVAVVCSGGAGACALVRRRLAGAGVELSPGEPGTDAIRVLVGPWARLEADPAAAQIGRGPEVSGVFAKFDTEAGCRLEALDEGGDVGLRLDAGAGLVAATRRYEDPPTWVVTGCDSQGVRQAALALDARSLDDRFSVAAEPGSAPLPLPLRGG